MTENTTIPDAKRDGKAQAAADKAYRKASRPWFKKKRFLFPLILLVIIIITTVSNGGKKDSSTSVATSSETAAAAAAAPAAEAPAAAPAAPAAAAFPGAKNSDVVGQAGAALKVGDATVTASAIAAGDATFGNTICTSTTLSNSSKDTISFNAFDWKLQTPSGTIVTTGFAGSKNMLSSGEIAPGGKASGDVCFDNKNAEAGQFVVFYEPVFKFFSDRAAWVNAL